MQEELNIVMKASDILKKNDFAKAFSLLNERIAKIDNRNVEEFKQLRRVLTDLAEKVNSENLTEIGALKKEALGYCNKMMKKMGGDMEKGMSEHETKMDEKIASIENGKDADEEKILTSLQEKLPTPEAIANEITSSGEKIRDSLELLTGEDRLDKSAIKGLEEEFKKSRGTTAYAGARGIDLYVDGSLKGLTRYINLVAGTGVVLSYNTVGARTDITINASASGTFGVILISGTVNDSNVDFVAASEPTLVVVNGTAYRTGHGVTISGTTITLDNPVGVSGDIYGL